MSADLIRERAREEMNQFRRAVTDENHVWIHATPLRQFLSELPTIGVRIVHDLLELPSGSRGAPLREDPAG